MNLLTNYESFKSFLDFPYEEDDQGNKTYCGFVYSPDNDTLSICVILKKCIKEDEIYYYQPQLLSTLALQKPSVFYFIPLDTIHRMTEEQYNNTISKFFECDLIKKCKMDRKLRNIDEDFND